MKKPNRRSKRSSVSDSSPQAAIGEEQQQQQHYDKRIDDLEKENEALKGEVEELKQKLPNVSPTSVDGLPELKENDDSQKLRILEDQVMELKKKLYGLSQLSARRYNSAQKQRSGEAGVSLQNEIQRLKVQKVQLLCKIKLESVQFRLSKASLEKEVLQLKKEQRRKDYEIRKLLALNEKQKLVLQRKTEEASMATKRLKDLLESRKASSYKISDTKSGTSPGVQGIEVEFKIAARVEEIRADYERQMEEMADEVRKFEEEAEMLRQENFRCLLQDKEVDCKVRDSELKDLKEEILRLSNFVNQLGRPKAEVHRKKPDVDLVKPYVSGGSSIGTMDTSESEYSGGNSGKFTPQVCCSCSKKSLCKTLKCACRAGGGNCGTGCGCTTSKCTNRADGFIKVDDSLQQKAARDSLHCSGNSESENVIVVPQPRDFDNDCLLRRKPLHEIGNTLVNTSPTAKIPRQKTRGQKPVIQHDVVEPSISLPENAEGLKKAETITQVDNETRLTRARRSQISE